ncbi:hypothetical protein CWE12_06865 [Aliidiomarina sedimenti]|uniref:DUF4168 domain-containing protein n=1 Tax=Aliidiomarina sedimenti TaxID=1933879 RepID=A0ABY0C1B7_9GAMM|nr:DUF4168 domain-containing protein [Aliidiomarina sedimenti]RUO30954.1 hypothetical protein CWE12_06865 [Aliidiomarina sedimenti]
MFKRTFALSAIAAALFSMPALAQEQQQQQQQQAQQQQAQQQMEEMASEPVTDEQLEQFADALDEIERINDEFVAELEEAENQEEAQELQIAAQSEMVEAVENSGLSVEEYNAIAYRMQNDPEIQERIEDLRS